MFNKNDDCWHLTQESVDTVYPDDKNQASRYPHYTLKYVNPGSPETIKEHFTYYKESRINITSIAHNNPVDFFNALLDEQMRQLQTEKPKIYSILYPKVINYYAGEGTGQECYLRHIRGLASKPIKKASDELRVIKKTLAQDEEGLLRVDEFIELLGIIKNKVANASSGDDVKYQLQILNNLMQEAKQLLKASVEKANNQTKQIKQEKLTKQAGKPKFNLKTLIDEVDTLAFVLDMPFGTRGFEGGEQYYQGANSEYQNQVRQTKARLKQLHSAGSSLTTCQAEIAKLAKSRKEYQADINNTIRGAKNQRARGQMQEQVSDGCLSSFIVLALTGSLVLGGFSYGGYQIN
jgi:hypothetical protein